MQASLGKWKMDHPKKAAVQIPPESDKHHILLFIAKQKEFRNIQL